MGNWLKEDSTEKLRQIAAYHGNADAIGRAAKAEIQLREAEMARDESSRKEASNLQMHQDLISSQKENHKNDNGDTWYKKIVIGVIVGVIVGALLLYIKQFLGF